MKKVAMVMLAVMVAVMLGYLCAQAEDSKEVINLKRDLAQERVLRIQSQLSLMQQQFADGQKYLQEVKKELDDLNAQLKAMEPKKETSKPEGKGK